MRRLDQAASRLEPIPRTSRRKAEREELPPAAAVVCKDDTDEWLKGPALFEWVREHFGPRIPISFSAGKDSVALAIAAKPYFDELIPLYFYHVPGLQFVERALAYYEQHLFGRPILRLPHQILWRDLVNGTDQPPHRYKVLEPLQAARHTFRKLNDAVRASEHLGDRVPFLIGTRAKDSAVRRMALMRSGPYSARQRTVWGIWDWSIEDVTGAIAGAGLGLPHDYAIWSHSFDGIQHQFLAGIREHYPDDYATILRWFPLAEATFARWRA